MVRRSHAAKSSINPFFLFLVSPHDEPCHRRDEPRSNHDVVTSRVSKRDCESGVWPVNRGENFRVINQPNLPIVYD